MRRVVLLLMFAVMVILPAHTCHAVIFQFEIFTSNGSYYDDPGWNLYVDVWNGEGVANFTFYNDSAFQSSIAQIYYDDGSLLGIDEITNNIPYTDFNTPPTPGNLPQGNVLVPPFNADREFSIGAENPAPSKGVNEGDTMNEWVNVKFDLINGGTLDDVIAELKTGALRIGLHVINLPDGSSESAIMVPEPASVLLLGLGTLALLRRRRRA